MGKKLLEKLSEKDQKKLKKLQALLQDSDSEEQSDKEKSLQSDNEDSKDDQLSDLSDLETPKENQNKKSTSITHGEKQKDGSYQFDLDDPKKKLCVSSFKGNTYVSLREFYQKDGDYMPTKKGCSIKVEQWKYLKKIVNEVDQAIKKIK